MTSVSEELWEHETCVRDHRGILPNGDALSPGAPPVADRSRSQFICFNSGTKPTGFTFIVINQGRTVPRDRLAQHSAQQPSRGGDPHRGCFPFDAFLPRIATGRSVSL